MSWMEEPYRIKFRDQEDQLMIVCLIYMSNMLYRNMAQLILSLMGTVKSQQQWITYIRRTGGHQGVMVNFTGSIVIQSTKDEFLCNLTNTIKKSLFSVMILRKLAVLVMIEIYLYYLSIMMNRILFAVLCTSTRAYLTEKADKEISWQATL